MSTVKDSALFLRENIKITDALRRFAPHVQLHRNGAEWCGACPRCGGDDRFYIVADGTRCACRQCHTQRMDTAGLVAWLLRVPMHEALDVLNGRSHAAPVPPVSVSPSIETTQTATWRTDAAERVQLAHKRLLRVTENAGAARAYLESRGLTQATWEAFSIGYDKAPMPGTQEWRPAICWPVCHETSGETVAVKYRFFSETHAGKRYTSLAGSQFRERLFGTALLWSDKVSWWRCLCITEGEINSMSCWQAANDAGIDVLSFGSESQKLLPAWTLELASKYGCVLVWIDDAAKANEVKKQLPTAVTLRSVVTDAGKQDANELLKSGRLGGLLQTARLSALPDVTQRENVLWQLWEAWRDGVLNDAGQVAVGRQLAQTLGRSASWP